MQTTRGTANDAVFCNKTSEYQIANNQANFSAVEAVEKAEFHWAGRGWHARYDAPLWKPQKSLSIQNK
jgi:hypothetical protein